MKIPIRVVEGVYIISPEGEPAGQHLAATVIEALDDVMSNIVVNFEGVTTINRSGFDDLGMVTVHLEDQGGKLKLCNVPPAILNLMTNDQRGYFITFDSEDEAVASFA